MQEQNLIQFMIQNSDKLMQQTVAHIGLTFISLLIAVLIGLPLGIFIARKKSLSGPVLGFAGVLQTIPSIALLGFMIPLLGIGSLPAITALFLYALLPIIRNTYTGIKEVNPVIIDAARGMGMSRMQIFTKIEFPLALPVILAGIRTATVINVGVATLAAYIAAGGLGEFIFGGIALNNINMILAGAIPAALLALLFDFLLSLAQKIRPRNIRKAIIALPIIILASSSVYIVPFISSQIEHDPAKKFVAGFTPEFMGREDGYLGLKSKYELDIETVVISDAVMYNAIYEKKLDLISGYSTDGRLKAFDLITLEDDKTIFPPYYCAPLVRDETLKKYPELESALNLLAGKINDSIMTELNYRADYLHELPEKVAKDFLIEKNLYKQPRNGSKGIVRIGSKIFTEQYILINMYSILIEGNTDLKVDTKTGLGGTKICFDALVNDQIDMYPEYTGTGLLVLLQPSQHQIQEIINNKNKVFNFVQEEFRKKYNLSWLTPIGFNNAYALMMRKSQSDEINVHSISQLKNYLSK
jgi:osmoprotectant transport system permease protein